MSSLGKILFRNWRNKIVALFFAVSIWFVAFQSEKRTYPSTVTMKLEPLRPDETVIVSTTAEDEFGGEEPFKGEIELTFSGPRKEIDFLRERLKRNYAKEIEPEQERYHFTEEDFNFPAKGVSIIKIQPPSVKIQQEPVEEVLVQDLKDKVELVPSEPNYRVIIEVVKPETQSIRLRVPRSLNNEILSVRVKVPWPYGKERIEHLYGLNVVSSNSDLHQRTVRIWDDETLRWVSPANASKVHVIVEIKEKDDTFEHEVKLTFQVPQMETPFTVSLNDVPGDTIPVKFRGPSKQIALLRHTLREQPGLSLVVPLRRPFDPETGGESTFTEDSLILPERGFPDVRFEQHESRKQALKTAWSYTITVLPEKDGEGSKDGGTSQ